MAPDYSSRLFPIIHFAVPALYYAKTDSLIQTMRILREPLFHFLILGALVFGFYLALRGNDTVADNIIHVSPDKVENLAALFQRTWQRPPRAEELEGLVNDYLREEVIYREGVAMGLDQNDTVIRRRIRQKLEFVIEDMMRGPDPDDSVLEEFLADQSERFRIPPRYSFQHIYFSPERRGEDALGDAKDVLQRLQEENAGARSIDTGDPIMLDSAYQLLSPHDISRLFGNPFAENFERLAVGQWHGPLKSGFGFHLLRIDEKVPGRTPALGEVRGQVVREWDTVRRDEARESFYEELLARYQIVVEYPESVDSTSGTAENGS